MDSKLFHSSIAAATALILVCSPNVFAAGADDGPGHDAGNDNSGSCREVTRADGTINNGAGNSSRVQFHVSGVLRDDLSVDGRLDLRDRATDARIRSRRLTAYEVVDATTRRLTFELEDASTAVVTLSDVSKRGKEDTFQVIAGSFSAAGQLRNGNVRLGRKGCDDVVAASTP